MIFLFKHVLLYTDKLKQLRRFYVNILQFDAIESTETQFSIQIGKSKLTFSESDQPAFYHYAINIPGNQFVVIKDWIQTRYHLNKQGGINEIYKPIFDADAMYIEDPAGNLIQLIGRRNRDFLGSFSHEVFLDISEVTLVSSHVKELGEQIQDIDLPLLSGIEADPKAENFLGRDDSYIVLVNEKYKPDFLKGKLASFPLEMTLDNERQLSLDTSGKLSIS